jgi:hypothetical protein
LSTGNCFCHDFYERLEGYLLNRRVGEKVIPLMMALRGFKIKVEIKIFAWVSVHENAKIEDLLTFDNSFQRCKGLS